MTKRNEKAMAKLAEEAADAAFDKTLAITNQLDSIFAPLTREELLEVLVMAVAHFCRDGDSEDLALGTLVVRVGENIQLNRKEQR